MTEIKQDELEQRAEEIAGDLGFYAMFRVGLPNDLQSIEEDTARADISNEILVTLMKLSKKYDGLTLDYNFGYQLRSQIAIPLIED